VNRIGVDDCLEKSGRFVTTFLSLQLLEQYAVTASGNCAGQLFNLLFAAANRPNIDLLFLFGRAVRLPLRCPGTAVA